MSLLITDEKLQQSVKRFFEKLEKYYPEHKVFALDSIDKTLRETLSTLYKKAECSTAEEFLAAYGFQIVSGEEVKAIRGSVTYTPGNEPDIIKNKVENMLRLLKEYYPDRNIPRGLQNDHKSLAHTVSGLYQWLGYETASDMLTAYGFEVQFGKGRPSSEHQGLITMLQEKYKDGNKLKTMGLLIHDNPNYAAQLKTLQNKATELFGMSLEKYFKEIGILREAELNTTIGRDESATAPRNKGKQYRYYLVSVDNMDDPVPCTTSVRTVHEGDHIEMYSFGDEKIIGQVKKVCFYNTDRELPCPIEEMHRYIRKLLKSETLEIRSRVQQEPERATRVLHAKVETTPANVQKVRRNSCNYFYLVSVDGMQSFIPCVTSGQLLHGGDYIEMSDSNDTNRKTGQVRRICRYTPDENLPYPTKEMHQFIRKLSESEVREIEEKKAEQIKYIFCDIRFQNLPGVLSRISPFDDVEVGDVVQVHYEDGAILGTVTKVEHKSKKTVQEHIGYCREITEIKRSIRTEKALATAKVEALVQKCGTAPFVSQPANPEIDEKYSKMSYFSGAVFRGLETDVLDALQTTYPAKYYPLSYKEDLGNGICQFECASALVPRIIESYPNLKAVFFAENWKENKVYLAFSDSGYATVSSLRLIGDCDFYSRDRWSLLHDPCEDSFTFGNTVYKFLEKELWEKCNYVLTDGTRQLSGSSIIPSKPYAKKSSRDPCQIIKIHYPENGERCSVYKRDSVSGTPSNIQQSNRLAGKIFVVTGGLDRYPYMEGRDIFKKLIEQNGGKLTQAVSFRTTALITNYPYSDTVKIRRATEYGIEIISEYEFFRRYMSEDTNLVEESYSLTPR